MIKISQIKVSLDKICQKVPAELVKKGIIGEEEKQLVRRAAAKQLHIREEEMKEFQILRRSMDARKKHQMQYIYQVVLQVPQEEKVLHRYGKNDAVLWKGFGNGNAKESGKKAADTASVPDMGQKKRPVIVGMVVAAVSGLIAIKTMIKIVSDKKLSYFSYYVWALGTAVVLYSIFA